MSHERTREGYRFNCDGVLGRDRPCRTNYEADTGMDFRVAWEEAKAMGWSNMLTYVRRINTWRHFCPGCTAKQEKMA